MQAARLVVARHHRLAGGRVRPRRGGGKAAGALAEGGSELADDLDDAGEDDAVAEAGIDDTQGDSAPAVIAHAGQPEFDFDDIAAPAPVAAVEDVPVAAVAVADAAIAPAPVTTTAEPLQGSVETAADTAAPSTSPAEAAAVAVATKPEAPAQVETDVVDAAPAIQAGASEAPAPAPADVAVADDVPAQAAPVAVDPVLPTTAGLFDQVPATAQPPAVETLEETVEEDAVAAVQAAPAPANDVAATEAPANDDDPQSRPQA